MIEFVPVLKLAHRTIRVNEGRMAQPSSKIQIGDLLYEVVQDLNLCERMVSLTLEQIGRGVSQSMIALLAPFM